LHKKLLEETYIHADELCFAGHNSSYVEPYIMQSYKPLCRKSNNFAA